MRTLRALTAWSGAPRIRDSIFTIARESAPGRAGTRRCVAGSRDCRGGYEALFGVQTRNPSGDSRLAEFCLSLPDEQHRVNGEPRSLIRRAMKDRLPAEVLANRRRGVQASDWFEDALANRSRLLDGLDRMERCPLAAAAIDFSMVRAMLKRLSPMNAEQRRCESTPRAILGWALMTGSFLLWFERWSPV
jgi:asparagine synthase (glutamine-hydrolysing)